MERLAKRGEAWRVGWRSARERLKVIDSLLRVGGVFQGAAVPEIARAEVSGVRLRRQLIVTLECGERIRQHADGQGIGDARTDLALQRKQIAEAAIVGFGPQVGLVAHLISCAVTRTF